ncbi:hypothetical protein BDV95DRAFT_650181 [Massariosphaeria phaeospora]|uniref:Uncharacterized protein n=1 Tax=Massariosphaeria phaeospora TaxID=100035 RepID=A0A7C8IMS2_9PLEO|nr:hypothetical protein BDV95DRAFT_650181 [Massariosphaeria phaeospora]
MRGVDNNYGPCCAGFGRGKGRAQETNTRDRKDNRDATAGCSQVQGMERIQKVTKRTASAPNKIEDTNTNSHDVTRIISCQGRAFRHGRWLSGSTRSMTGHGTSLRRMALHSGGSTMSLNSAYGCASSASMLLYDVAADPVLGGIDPQRAVDVPLYLASRGLRHKSKKQDHAVGGTSRSRILEPTSVSDCLRIYQLVLTIITLDELRALPICEAAARETRSIYCNWRLLPQSRFGRR